MAQANIPYHHVKMNEDVFYHWIHTPMIITTKNAGGADIDTDGKLLFASTGTEIAFTSFFIREDWNVGSSVEPHLRWSKTTDASGDVVWQIRHRHVITGEVPEAFGSWTDVTSRTGTVDATQKIFVDHFPVVETTTTAAEEEIQIDIRRKHDDADDDYGADAKLWSFSMHFQVFGPGVINEP